MKDRKITLRVTEDTYRRWKAAAKANYRTLSLWLHCRADGMDATAPELADKVQERVTMPASTANADSLPAQKTSLIGRLKTSSEPKPS